nr:cytochrome P450 [Agasicles hygrophila]
MYLLTFILIVFSALFSYIIIWKQINKKYMKNLSGPEPNYFLGNLAYLFFIKPEESFEQLQILNDKYGTFIKCFTGPIHFILIVFDIKFLENILSSTKLIDKSVRYSFLHRWLGTGLLTSTGKKWKTRRRLISPSFHFSILETYIEIFDNVSEIFIQKLNKEVGQSSVDLSPLTTSCTLDIICEAAMDTKLNAQDDQNLEYVRAVKTMCEIFVKRIVVPLPDILYILTPNYYKERKALKVLHNHTNNIINKKIWENKNGIKSVPESKKRLSFMDLLLQSSLSKEEIREEVDTFMFEGHDTSSVVLGFAMYCLANNPEKQEKAFQEQKAIFDTKDDLKIETVDLQAMKYLEMVIKETLRLYPPVPMLGRRFSETFEFGGNIYPKDLEVLIPIYIVHRNPEHFPEPFKFIPERFEESKIIPYTYLPFSAGPRNCIGQKFAMLEIKTILSKVIRHFELIPATPFHEIQPFPSVVLQSKNGIRVALKKRT